MKAAVLYFPGGSKNLTIEQRPIPEPMERQVLIKIKAFGINRSEIMTRKGLSPDVLFPRILGIECVGEVVTDPSDKFAKGTKVACLMGGMGREYDGSYAEFMVAPLAIVCPFESDMEWEILGALPEMFHTVYGSLYLALKIKSTDTLLIRGGTSSIGLLALSLAKKEGLTIISTTRKPEKSEYLIQQGADHVIVDNGEIHGAVKKIFASGVDKVLDLVGTTSLKDSLKCCLSGGSVCMTGMLSEQWSIPDFAPMEYIPATVNLTVFDSGQIGLVQEAFQSFVKEVEKGFIKIKIANVFRLDEIILAHQLMESNNANGKIVITV